MNKEEIELISFQIIAHAGDALDSFQNAINSAKENNFESANEYMKKGKISMIEAHKVQTKLLNLEASGKEIMISVIFSRSFNDNIKL